MTSILGTESIQHPNGTSAMTVAADGLVSFGNVKSGNTPCFLAIFSSPLNSQSNNVAVKVPFNSATFNQGGGTFDTSNYRYTPKVAGFYFIYGSIQWIPKSADDNVYLETASNGAVPNTKIAGSKPDINAKPINPTKSIAIPIGIFNIIKTKTAAKERPPLITASIPIIFF